jgi:hypothetical protein
LITAASSLDPRAFADVYRNFGAIYMPVELLEHLVDQLYPGVMGFCGVCSRLPADAVEMPMSEMAAAWAKLDDLCSTHPPLGELYISLAQVG